MTRLSRAHLTTVRYENPIPTGRADRLRPRPGYGKQGRGVCPHCNTEVVLRFAGSEYRDPPNLQTKDIVCGNHAIGGGKKTKRDYYCPGSGTRPIGSERIELE